MDRPGSAEEDEPVGSLLRPILIGGAIAAIVLTLISLHQIAGLRFPDPDDAMRYLEVRDWISGQSWWDVSQHRLWGGHFAMHWSRLVDLPLAAIMIALDPVVGPAWSARVAMTVVPLLTLGCAIALAAVLTRRLAGIEPAKMAILLTPLSVPLIYQLRPMRIDHHGWQVVMALAAVVALFGRVGARSGAITGAALAVLVVISLEGLPITAAIVGLALVAWAVDPTRRPQAAALAATLFVTVCVLHVATRGPAALLPACDAIAPAWIAALGVATVGALATLGIGTKVPLPARLTLLGASGIAGIATLRLSAPGCTAGPFATLDPLVYRFWYQNVSEGLPVWEQVPAWAAMTIGMPIIGLAGGALAWRESAGPARDRWTMMLALASFAFALSLLVIRAGTTANALAVPGAAWLLDRMLRRARAVPGTMRRTIATAAALLAATPGLAAGALFGIPVSAAQPGESGRIALGRRSCDYGREVADFAKLPTATLFAPLDISPSLLALTPHRAIGSGYHRNAAAIHYVLATFLGSPAFARRHILASGADYVVGCPGENETEIYKKAAPNGFWARLERGERFDWLEPVDLDSPALAWRVIDPSHRAKRPLP